MYYGDTIVVERKDETTFRVIDIETPSPMVHNFFIMHAPPHDLEFSKILHELEGEWECDAGTLFLLHVLLVHVDELCPLV